MSRGLIFAWTLGLLLTVASQASAGDPFQLLGTARSGAIPTQTVGWPFHPHHHGHWHGYAPRYSYRYYAPRYSYWPRYSSYSSFRFGVSIGPLSFGSCSYPVYSYRYCAPTYRVYTPIYTSPCYMPYGYGYSYYGFANAGPEVASPLIAAANEPTYSFARSANTVSRPTNYVIAPPKDSEQQPLFVYHDEASAIAAIAKALTVDSSTPRNDLQQVVDNLRQSNATSQARARQWIEQGDRLFAQQRFASALDRYKSAVASAPDMAAAYFREGHAFVATHQFDLAAKAFKLGVLLSKDIPADTIALDELYGDNLLTKQSRMEAVAQSALLDQQNADLLFLVGILLHQDGQVERAKTFFDHAAQREGSDAEYLRPFLAKPTASSLDGLTDV
ncbi:MAG: hypothetical protein KDA38_00925 [Planctomycetales bacterium]|nr:hypothetical protein [Planctomycetales bacterium]